jgi:hypothetical protein
VKRSADLDLAIDSLRRLTRSECGALADAFEESDLPYGVDLTDLRSVGETFRAIVERERVALWDIELWATPRTIGGSLPCRRRLDLG